MVESSDIRAQLARILESPLFAQAARQRRFLEYLVSQTLEGHTERLKGYTLGLEVFDRPPHFDPTVDSVVRVEAGRLRARLREYYATEGVEDPIRLELPKGSYVVQAHSRAADAESRSRNNTAGPSEDEAFSRLAVLPFSYIGDDSTKEYFADGMTEVLITSLAQLSGLRVIARYASFHYKSSTLAPSEIAEQLGVDYLVEGSVQRCSEHLRVTVQLCQASTGVQLWADRYDARLEDVFAVQDDITDKVVRALRLRLTGSEQRRLQRVAEPAFEAYDLTLQALAQFQQFTPASVDSAIRLFDEATSIDPEYAPPYIQRARARVYVSILQWDPEFPQVLKTALQDVRTGVALDPERASGQAVLAWVQLWRKQRNEALLASRRAVELGPSEADAHYFRSYVLSSVGDWRGALAATEQVFRLSPIQSVQYLFARGCALWAKGDLEAALPVFHAAAEANPNFTPAHYYLTSIYGTLGDRDRAQRARRDFLRFCEHIDVGSFVLHMDPELERRFLAGCERAGLQVRHLAKPRPAGS